MAYRSGGYYGGGMFGDIPPMIRQLILLNAVVFLLMALLGRSTQGQLIMLFGLVPIKVVTQGMVWQLATYMFLHGGLMHLIFNMFALFMFGSELERWWGSREFLKYYLVCGVGAGVINALVAFAFGGAGIPTIGASGAIFGILLAYGMAFPHRQILLWFLFPIPARTFVLIFGFLELVMAVQNPVGGGVARFAHLGGMLIGLVYLKWETIRWKWRRLASQYGSSGPRRPRGGGSTADDAARRAEVDRILDKIKTQGMGSLTPEERRTLEESAERARRRQRGS